MRRLLGCLVTDDSGQDLVEYALLAGLIALVTIPALNAIEAALKAAYLSWNTAMQACWQMPAPGKGGGC
jgi:Flp pilus assembly pilin Flp